MRRACSLVVPAACALAWGCAAQDSFLVERPLARTELLPEDRREPPATFSLPRAPRVSRAQLENGMRVQAVERPGTSTVSLIYVTAAVRIGEDYAPTYVADALLAGARREDGRVLHPIALSGRTPWVWTAPSGTMIGLTCGPEQLDDAVELLASMVQRPLFDAGWLAPVRSRTELDLLGLRSRLMTWRMAREHEGKTFELNVEAIAEQVIGLDHAALAQLHGRLFRPEDSALIVVGDVAARHAREATERHFGAWRGAPVPAAAAKGASAAPASPATRTGRRITVFPGSGIPSVTLFQDAPDLDSKDAVAFELLTQVLSSIGPSSMRATLRYRHGHAYAAGASTVTVPESGRYLLLRAAVGSDTLAQDLGEMLRILARQRTDLIEARALEGAKAHYGSRLALALSSSTEIARYLAGVELGSAPPVEAVGDELLAVTPEGLRQVAQRYLDPERATVFVVGDASGAVDALRELGEVSLE